jgi:hypothetical protein
MRRSRWVALALGAALSLATIPLFDATMGLFSLYAIKLQSSHPILWSEWPRVFREPAGRIFVVALAALAVSFTSRARDAERARARDQAVRAMLVTIGVALPSVVAFLKLGGRSNSLLPMAIGGTVVLARLAAAVRRADGRHDALPLAVALASALALCPTHGAVTGAFRADVVARHARAVALIARETHAGRRTLFAEGTAAWIEAGRRDIPLDRWQTVSELVMGQHTAAEAFFARLEDGTYATVITSARALDPGASVIGLRLSAILARAYRVEPAGAEEGPDHYRVYRRVAAH